MSEPLDKANLLEKIGFTIHEVLRYGYGGILAFFVAALCDPAGTGKLIETLTVTFAILGALAGGVAIYSLHRALFGWLMEWIQDSAHRRVFEDKCCNHDWRRCSSKRHYLESRFSIPTQFSSDAFRVIRDKLFEPAKRDMFYLQHSEIHTLYITFLVLLSSTALLFLTPGLDSSRKSLLILVFLILGFASLIGGILGDIWLSKQECVYLRTLDDVEVQKLLRDIQRAPPGTPVGASSITPGAPPPTTPST